MLHILKEAGTAVLLVTHDSEEAMFMSDQIAVIREGKLEQSGRPIDLYCRPANAFVAEFFGEVNRLDGFIKAGHLKTPFGEFPVDGAEEGAAASMIIRYEGLTVHPDQEDGEGFARAEVMEARLLGRYSLIHFSMPSANHDEELHFHARVPGLNMFTPGDEVTLSLDHTHVFVFRRRDEVQPEKIIAS